MITARQGRTKRHFLNPVPIEQVANRWISQVRGQVQLRAGGLEQSPLTWENVKDGWIWILDSMKTLLETGQPLPRVSEDEELASADKPDRAGVP